MPGPNVARQGLVKTTPSYIGCTLSLRNNHTRQITPRLPAAKDCSAAKVLTLAPVRGVGGGGLAWHGGSN